MINKSDLEIHKTDKLKNLDFIVAIGVLTIRKVNLRLIICLFLMILVKKFWDIFIKDTIQLCLHMDKLGQENLIRSKVINKKVYFSFVFKTYLIRKKSKTMHKAFPHKLKLLTYKYIIKNSEICLTQIKKIKLKFSLLEHLYLFLVLILYFVNHTIKF